MKSLNKTLFAIALIAGGISLPAAAQFGGQYNGNGNFGVFEASSTVAAQPAATATIMAQMATVTNSTNLDSPWSGQYRTDTTDRTFKVISPVVATLDSPWGGQYNSDGNYGVFEVARNAAPTVTAQIAGRFVDGANSAM
ncbi:MAG: hypothetical protein EAZ30_03540 [Betaproteobacteria bacterium]|nr:MAG: hypothetical protein EAZ30_03540 [Betaproteobacteria bacterium]